MSLDDFLPVPDLCAARPARPRPARRFPRFPPFPFIAHAAEPQTLQPVVVTATRARRSHRHRARRPARDRCRRHRQRRAHDAHRTAADPWRRRDQRQRRARPVSGVFLRGSNAGHVVLLVDGACASTRPPPAPTPSKHPAGADPAHRDPPARRGQQPVRRRRDRRRDPGLHQECRRRAARRAWGSASGTRTRPASARRARPARAGRCRRAGASRGFSATNPAASFSYDPDADGYRNLNLGLNVEHELADGHSLALRSMPAAAASQFDAGPGTDDVNRQRLSSTALESRNRISADWRSLLPRRAAPTTSAPTAPSPASSTPTRTRRAGRTTSPRSAASGWRAWTGGARKWRATPPTR